MRTMVVLMVSPPSTTAPKNQSETCHISFQVDVSVNCNEDSRESRIALHNKNSTTRCGRFFYTTAADLWTTVSVCGEWTPWTSPFLCLSNPIGCGTLHQLSLQWPGVDKVQPRDKIQSGMRWNSVIDTNPLLRAL